MDFLSQWRNGLAEPNLFVLYVLLNNINSLSELDITLITISENPRVKKSKGGEGNWGEIR